MMMNNMLKKLNGTSGDLARELSSDYQRKKPYNIENLLPISVGVLVLRSGNVVVRFNMNSGEKKSFNVILPGDEIIVTVDSPKNISPLPLLQSYTVTGVWKDITLGSITYTSTSGAREVKALDWDIRGVWLRNKIYAPLDVYHNKKKVAVLGSYNGLHYMGGGNNEFYYDNDREGLNFGDELEFAFSIPNSPPKRMNVVLNDGQIQLIEIGNISGGFWGADPDFSVYRGDENSFTPITYFPATQTPNRYRTIPTNRNSPFDI